MSWNKKGFSTLECLVLVVMVSILLLGGLTITYFAVSSNEITNLKQDAREMSALAQTAYLNIQKNNPDYIKISETGTKALCISLKGLHENHYINDLDDKYEGYIVIEENNGEYKRSIWIHNRKRVIEGYEYNTINKLTSKEIPKYTNENYSAVNKNEFNGASSDRGGFSSNTNYQGICINENIE